MIPYRFPRAGPILFFCLLFAGCALPYRGRSAYTIDADLTPYRFSSPSEFYLYLPSQYTREHEWPLFIGVHGAGGDGTDCLKWWQAEAEREGFILLCPSLADENGGWYADVASRNLRIILKQVRNEVHLGTHYFLAGFSAGAEFVQIYAMEDPDAVQGMAILASGNYYEPPARARTIPFLVVIGDQDNPISVGNAKEYVDLLENEEFSVSFHLIPGMGHQVTPEVLELVMEFYRESAALQPGR